jgi:hypothetical protein
VRAFLLGGAAPERWQGRKAVGAAPVSKNRLGLSRGPPTSMGIVAARLFDVARCEVAGRDHAGASIGATSCCRGRWRWMDRVRGSVCRARHVLCGEQCGARHTLVGAVFGGAWQDRAGGGRRAPVHELSHHIGGRGGGCGRRMSQISIRPPQQGQISTSWPVSSRRRSCQRCGEGSSGAGGGAASSSRQSASFSAR